MAKMCPMKGCREEQGMCMHEKLMALIVVVAIGFAAYKFLS